MTTTATTMTKRPTPSIKLLDHHSTLNTVAQQPNSLIWIDVENVRGKSGFELSHEQLIDKTKLTYGVNIINYMEKS